MKLRVLALDYDGTIAHDGRVPPAVVEAIREARAVGIAVVLVTGRILSHLRRVMGEKDLFDAIVGENGAVLAFPNARARLLGHPPPQAILQELRLLKVNFTSGDCVIDSEASAAPQIVDAIKRLELPLVLEFNRGRVMVLPQGINKGTGLREALKIMRLSLHNCIGIGDAENDFAFLEACEISVAVAWGNEALCAIADEVVDGQGPAAVAAYIKRVIAQNKMPPNRTDRRRLILGETADGQPLEIAVHGHNILIAGDSGSGKSWLTGLFCEQLILQGYSLCLIDPEGDYATLQSLPGVVVFSGDQPPRWSSLVQAASYPENTVVIDLSAITNEAKMAYVNELLPNLSALRGDIGLPHWIVVDEAHYFLNQPDLGQRVDLELAAYIFITYRPSWIHPVLLGAVESIIVTPLTNAEEVRTLVALCEAQGAEPEWRTLLGGLGIDEAAVLPRDGAVERLPLRFTIDRRLTAHVRHRTKYLEVPLPEARAFVFNSQGEPFGPPARTIKEFVTVLQLLPVSALEAHIERGDFSRWIAEVFGNEPLAAAVRNVEKQYRDGHVANLASSIVAPICEHYELK
jgi:hydroxymethylpyrimidine pyrophosphatase-like HAD family hydrolase